MSDTQSVLDQMTAAIMGVKEEKAATLTPVGMESARPAVARVKGDTFPFDSGLGEQIAHSAKVIRSELATLEAALRSIERAAGLTEGGEAYKPPVSPKEEARQEQAATEKQADDDFRARFEAQTEDAKRQVFTTADEPADVGWVCPTHGDGSVRTLTSRKGRTYRACGVCTEFERG